jgi:hypothetical protein
MSAMRAMQGHRDRQILCGLFLSKFDKDGLGYLGFSAFTEAFNAMGLGIGAKPASIKNYRDEFDPQFPNRRRGWHSRPLREHCRRILEEYKEHGLAELGEIVKESLLPMSGLESLPEVKRVMDLQSPGPTPSFANRLITGRAAEQYFREHYARMPEFGDASLTDTTEWGCGFDFKASPRSSGPFVAIEVKGMRCRSGPIQFRDEDALARPIQPAGGTPRRQFMWRTLRPPPRHAPIKARITSGSTTPVSFWSRPP